MRNFFKSTALLAIAGLAFQAAAQSISTDWNKVISDAKREGSVVLYSATVGSTTMKEIHRQFESRYGVRVLFLEGRSSEIRERARAEQAAGRFVGDVLFNGSSSTELMKRDGVLQPLGQIPNARNFVPPFTSDDIRVSANATCYGILVNTNLVKPADEPKSWRDLTDAKWQGKIISDDMRALGGGSTFFFATQQALGTEFHEKLAKQKLHFAREIRNNERRVALGEYPIYMPEVLPYFIQLKGLPVKFLVPAEGCPYVGFELSTLRNPPHPNAAKLLINFYLEQESQLRFANDGYMPVIQGIADLANPEIRELLKTPTMGTSNADRQNEMLDLANKIYK